MKNKYEAWLEKRIRQLYAKRDKEFKFNQLGWQKIDSEIDMAEEALEKHREMSKGG